MEEDEEGMQRGYLEIGSLNSKVVQPYLRMAVNYYCQVSI